MNNKDFISDLASRLGIPVKEAQRGVSAFALTIADTLEAGDVLSVQNFGSFEIKKKLERIVVNPTTRQRQLIPPKLAIAFKQAPSLKEKLNATSATQ